MWCGVTSGLGFAPAAVLAQSQSSWTCTGVTCFDKTCLGHDRGARCAQPSRLHPTPHVDVDVLPHAQQLVSLLGQLRGPMVRPPGFRVNMTRAQGVSQSLHQMYEAASGLDASALPSMDERLGCVDARRLLKVQARRVDCPCHQPLSGALGFIKLTHRFRTLPPTSTPCAW